MENSVQVLDKLVCEFCCAVGEPIPIDAIEVIKKHGEALKTIVSMPIDGDYDYSPGLSERLIAEEALRGTHGSSSANFVEGNNDG